MKILLFGSQGMLGYAMKTFFEKSGHWVISLSRTDFDISKLHPEHLEAIVDREKPSAIINAAGVIKPQIARLTIEEVLKVNSIFPRNLSLLAKRKELPCIHITTDCVYSGKKGNYNEDDFFDAEDVYGLSKNGGDISEAMTLRTSIIGEESGQSRSLIAWAISQKNKPVNGFTNHQWNGITTIQLAEVCHSILSKNLYKPGIFHIHSPNTVTKKELLEQISNTYGLNLQVSPFESPEDCNRSLSTKYELSAMLVKKTIQEQLNDMRSFFGVYV